MQQAKLKGLREITDYLRIGQQTFYELLKRGLPVRMFGNAYRADPQLLDEFYSEFIRDQQGMNHGKAETTA